MYSKLYDHGQMSYSRRAGDKRTTDRALQFGRRDIARDILSGSFKDIKEKIKMGKVKALMMEAEDTRDCLTNKGMTNASLGI